MDITIYRGETEFLIKQKLLPQMLDLLPEPLQLKARRYKSESSSYNYVVGRLLLKRGLDLWGLDNDLEKITFQQNGKPLLPQIYFNISHSGHQVVCGLSKDGQFGIDVEKINSINFENFSSMFSTHEWKVINDSDDPLRSFYWFWTRKESIIKALGLTLSFLHQIELDVSTDHFVVDAKRWFLKDVYIADGYMGAICCENEIVEINIVEFDF